MPDSQNAYEILRACLQDFTNAGRRAKVSIASVRNISTAYAALSEDIGALDTAAMPRGQVMYLMEKATAMHEEYLQLEKATSNEDFSTLERASQAIIDLCVKELNTRAGHTPEAPCKSD